MSTDARFLETEAIVVAYAMSRLNEVFLNRFRFISWKSAFTITGQQLSVAPASMKNLRDEFDPLHGFRRGWHQRPLRPNRQRVLAEFCDVRDDALLEIVDRILHRDQGSISEIIRPLALTKERVENVAERLRTGRLAEEYFLRNSEVLCGVRADHLVDCRFNAAGFDFGISNRPEIVIEVKGLKQITGSILFTDQEWRKARVKKEEFWLVVIGNLAVKPRGKVWHDPAKLFRPKSNIRKTSVLSWQLRLSVNS